MRTARTHCLTILAGVAARGWGDTLRMALLLGVIAVVLAVPATLTALV